MTRKQALIELLDALPDEEAERLCAALISQVASWCPDAAGASRLLRQWIEEDATTDPQELDARDREWEEFAASLNAHRSSHRRVYP